MAMYGDNPDLVDVQTPDGRTVTLPRALAGQFPGLQQLTVPDASTIPKGIVVPRPPPPPPPPPPDRYSLETGAGTGGGPRAPVGQQVGVGPVPIIAPIGELPAASSNPISVTSRPEVAADPNATSPSTGDYVAGTGDQLAKDMKVRAKQPRPVAAPVVGSGTPGAPIGPMTEADLRKTGAAGVYNAQTGAIDAEEVAGKNLADAQATQQIKMADAYERRNAELDKMFAKRAAEAEAAQQEIERKHVEYGNAVDKYASTKIDRSLDHPILAAISIAMGTVGAVLNGQNKVSAVDALMAGIDRKVAGQMADLEKQKGVLGMKREGINLLREKASDRLAMTNMAIAGETEKAARQIEELMARSNSDIVKANGAQLAAQLRARKVDALGKAVEFQTAKDERDKQFAEGVRHAKAQEGIAWSGQKLEREKFDWQKKVHNDEYALAVAKAMKDADAQGIGGNVVPVLDKDGKPTLDAKGNPEVTVQLLKNRDGSTWAPPEKIREKLLTQRQGVQDLHDIIPQIAAWREEYGGASTKTSPTAQAEYDRLVNKAIIAYTNSKGLSTSDEQSQKFARDAILGSDPSAYNISDVEDRIKRTLVEETNSYHTALQGAGFRGELPKFVNPYDAPKAAKQPGDDDFKKAIGAKPDLTQFITNYDEKKYGKAERNSMGGGNMGEKFKEAGGPDKYVIPSTAKLIDNLATVVDSTDGRITAKQKDNARAQLEAIRDRGPNEGTRAYAARALISDPGFEDPRAHQAGARETAPPRPAGE